MGRRYRSRRRIGWREPLSQGRPRSGGVWVLVRRGPTVCTAKRGSGSANAMTCPLTLARRVEGAPESGAAAKRRGVGVGEEGPTVCAAKRGSGSANAMTCPRHRPPPPPSCSSEPAARGSHPLATHHQAKKTPGLARRFFEPTETANQPSRCATAARSSSSSARVLSMYFWLNSSIGRSLTRVYSPFSVVTGKPKITPSGMP